MGFRKGSKTKYKGVIKRKDKFEAQIRVNKKYYYLGIYDNEHEAALAYNEALDRFNLNREKNIIGIDNRKFKSLSNNYVPKIQIDYFGVYRNQNYYYVKMQFNKEQITINKKFKTPEEAAIVYNIISLYLKGTEVPINKIKMNDELLHFSKNYVIPDEIKGLKEVIDMDVI